MEYQGIDAFFDTPPRGYFETVFNWSVLALRDNCRRCSTWFGLEMAAIRMFSLKLAMNKKFNFITEPAFGLKSMIFSIICSSGITVFYFFRYKVAPDPDWILIPGCPKTTVIQYFVDEIDGTSKVDARELHLLLTAIFEKVIPSILFPIITIILICELGKATKIVEDVRKTSSSSKTTAKWNKLVIHMTITFIIIEFPIGICKLITATRDTYEEAVIYESLTKILNMIYVPMSATHCIICYKMSSQYRDTVLKIVGNKKSNVHPTVSMITSNS